MKDDMRAITDFNTGSSGVFIVCEGNFMYGNASLSFYDNLNNKVENAVFLKANGSPLGDVAQSLSIYDSTAYIVINNSGKIYAINIHDFKFEGKITNLVSPRYMGFVGPNKAYVSDMYSGSISVINPRTFELLNEIPLSDNSDENSKRSSEQFVFNNDYLFTNSWSYNDLIIVIDINTDKLTDTIKVLPQPKKLLADRYNKIWVLCDGGFPGSDLYGSAGIVKINAETFEVEKTFLFDDGSNPADMQINSRGDTIYFINEHVYRFSVIDTKLPIAEYIHSEGRNFYSLGIDPSNSDLYVADAIDFLQAGKVYRYCSNKKLIDSFNVGIIPNSFVFK